MNGKRATISGRELLGWGLVGATAAAAVGIAAPRVAAATPGPRARLDRPVQK
jgi:hypothetical protein